MTKTYISQVELSIRTSSGRRILFDPVSSGGSCFRTNNLIIQEEMETHPLFNKDFRWDSHTVRAVEAANNIQEEVADAPFAEVADVESEPAQTEDIVETKDVEVSGVADAKDYLADNFGVMRTQMRNKTQIKEIADSLHINFIGL